MIITRARERISGRARRHAARLCAIAAVGAALGCGGETSRTQAPSHEPRGHAETSAGETRTTPSTPSSPLIEIAECTIGSSIGAQGGRLVLGGDGWLAAGERHVEHFDASGVVSDAAGQTVLTLRANGDVVDPFGDVAYRAAPHGGFVEAPRPPLSFEGTRLVQDGVRIAEVTSGSDDASRRAIALAVVLAGMREDLLYLDEDREVDASPVALPAQAVTIDRYPDGELVEETLVLSPEGELTGLRLPLIIRADGRVTQDSPDGHLLAWIDREGNLRGANGNALGHRFMPDGSVQGVAGERLAVDDDGRVPYAGGALRLAAIPATPACERIVLLHAMAGTIGARIMQRSYTLRARTIDMLAALARGTTSIAGREIVDARRREALAAETTALAEMDAESIARERTTARMGGPPGELVRGLGFDPRLCTFIELREGRAVACSRAPWPTRPIIVDLGGFAAGSGSSE